MLLLKTKWGNYLLHNALRIDFSCSKEKETWMAYISIDQFRHFLQGFETEHDACIFCEKVRRTVLHWLFISTQECFFGPDLDDACKAALQETIELGKVE